MNFNQTLQAGVPVEFMAGGDFFRVLGATGEVLTVSFYKNGGEVSKAENVGAGYAERFADGFDKVVLLSTATQAVKLVTRLGNDVRYDTPPSGNVVITNTSGAFVNAQKTVTNASAQMLAANASRRYLLIQNNDATGDIYVRFDGTAATIGTGIKIAAGGSYELSGYVPSGAVTAIGSIASNANVVTLEG